MNRAQVLKSTPVGLRELVAIELTQKHGTLKVYRGSVSPPLYTIDLAKVTP